MVGSGVRGPKRLGNYGEDRHSLDPSWTIKERHRMGRLN